ncbi:MAG: hypothetical protein U0S12_03405 [Fimbriimonadales bacterium]
MGEQLSESLKRAETILKNLSVAAKLGEDLRIGFKLGSKQTATFNRLRQAWSLTVDAASVADVAFRAPLYYCSVVRRQLAPGASPDANQLAYFFFLAECAVILGFYGDDGVGRLVERRRSSTLPEGRENDDAWAAVRGASLATEDVVRLGWEVFREAAFPSGPADGPAGVEQICALVASLAAE